MPRIISVVAQRAVVAETDDYFFELRGEAQLRLGAERGRFFRRAGRRQVARQLGAQLAASA